MLREIHLEHLSWSDKTCTGLRDLVMDEAELGLSHMPPVDLFASPTEQEAAALYRRSYDALEDGPAALVPTAAQLYDRVTARLQTEFRAVSTDEYDLLWRIAMAGGSLELDDRADYPAALSLGQRLWCVIEKTERSFRLTLPQTPCRLMELAIGEPGFQNARIGMTVMEQSLEAMLYMNGVLDAEGLLHGTVPALLRTAPYPLPILRRFLLSTFDCYLEGGGRLWLLHDGAASCGELIRQQHSPDAMCAMPDPFLLMTLCRDGMLPSEKTESDLLTACLEGAVRPEYTSLDVSEDVRLLLKQSVPLDEVFRVLASRLQVQPTRRMTDCVRQLRKVTSLWGPTMATAVMQ